MSRTPSQITVAVAAVAAAAATAPQPTTITSLYFLFLFCHRHIFLQYDCDTTILFLHAAIVPSVFRVIEVSNIQSYQGTIIQSLVSHLYPTF